jgi:hypothetical protein
MKAYRLPSTTSGQIGCNGGLPTFRTVARKARPGPNWYNNRRPAPAIVGAAASNSCHVAMLVPPDVRVTLS